MKRRPDRITASAVFLIALAVYVLTLAPSITWSHDAVDSGELVTAAVTGGVPHPPGYPTYMLLASLFARLPLGEPARGVNLLSALCAAGAAAVVCAAAWRLLDAGAAARSAPLGRRARSVQAALAGMAGLWFAFSPTLWSQAVVAEVYALHALFSAILLYAITALLAGGASRPSPRCFWLAAGLLGLGMGNHLSLAFFLPALGVAGLWGLREHPRRRAVWGLATLFFLLGLSIYLLVPVRARAGAPVNWGDPRTPERFWWLVSGQIYRRYFFAFPLGDMPARIGAWAALLRDQFGLWGIALIIAGVWFAWGERRRWLAATGLAYVLVVLYALGYDTADSYVYLIPSYALCALWMAYGLAGLWREIISLWEPARRAWPALIALCLLLPALNLARWWPAMDLSQDRLALSAAEEALQEAGEGALLLVHGDGPTFAVWYAHYALGRRPDVIVVNTALWNYDWYREGMSRQAPELAPAGGDAPATLDALIEAFRETRPVYLLGESTVLERYGWEHAGLLLRLSSP